MEIFNIVLFGSDAEWFCTLSTSEQKEWIKNNTNQTNDILIEEFLTSPFHKNISGCLKCGTLDNKFTPNANFSKSNVKANAIDNIEPIGNDGKRDSIERPKRVKRRKD